MTKYTETKVLALILARKGSRGIPSKNLSELSGKSLIERAINCVKESKCFYQIWVSTDDEKISEISKNCGARIHKRASYSATDEASSILALQEYLNSNPDTDYLCLIQCTSPFLKPRYLKAGFEKFSNGEFDSVFSVTRKKLLRWSESNPTLPLNFDPSNRPQRQSYSGDLCENGMFYFTRKSWIQKGLLQGGRCCFIEVPEEDSMDIDSPMDLFIAQQMLNYKCCYIEVPEEDSMDIDSPMDLFIAQQMRNYKSMTS